MVILVAMAVCPQTCMMKTTRCSAPRALSHRSNHSDSARFARKARAKRLLPHVWTFAKCPRIRPCKHVRLCGRLAHCLFILVAMVSTSRKWCAFLRSHCSSDPIPYRSRISRSVNTISSSSIRADMRKAPAPKIMICSTASDVATVTRYFLASTWAVFSM